jgi:PAS domain S-box-containing protein
MCRHRPAGLPEKQSMIEFPWLTISLAITAAIAATVAVRATAALRAQRKRVSDFVADLDKSQVTIDALTAATGDSESQLLASKRQLEALLETTPDALVVMDESRTIKVVNTRAERVFARDRRTLIGSRATDLVVPGHRVRLSENLAMGLAMADDNEETIRFELTGLRQEGDSFPAEVQLSQLETDDGKVVIAAFRDMTERARAEEELRSFADRLERSNRYLQHFASVAAHDLQEPLRKVRVFGDRLRDKYSDVLDERGQDYLMRITAATARMQLLIDDLLTYSRVSTEVEEYVPVDLQEVVNVVLSDLEVSIAQLDAVIDVGVLPTVHAVPGQMWHLFQNLISNSLKFHKEGSRPVIQVSAQVHSEQDGLLFGAVDADATCVLSVTDNGIGFEQGYADKIFGIFERLHSRAQYPGTGVGLALCKEIAERHGGGMTAQGTPGEGAMFQVILPMTQKVREGTAAG